MKKIATLSLILLSFVFNSRAQNVSIDPNNVDLYFTVDAYGDANATVFNNSNTARTFRWIRVSDAPGIWTSTVCDKNNCYSSNTNSQDFVLNAGANGLLKLTVNAQMVAGEGDYQILVYDLNDSIYTNAVFTVHAVAQDMTGISDPVATGVSVYPIPAKDILNINFDAVKNVNAVSIYNVVGQKLKTVNVYTGSKSVAVPVSELKKGVYFLRVYSNNKEAVTKTFTKE
ncbi:MAG: T9SS type A sorting domain-containing protein [Chitinophagaceae bacterium]|nr:T9SS type A sorting domain-containing protein [Chitinophagaceae bacterium]